MRRKSAGAIWANQRSTILPNRQGHLTPPAGNLEPDDCEVDGFHLRVGTGGTLGWPRHVSKPNADVHDRACRSDGGCPLR